MQVQTRRKQCIYSSDGVSRHVFRLERRVSSWDMVLMSRSWLSVDTCMSCIGSSLEFLYLVMSHVSWLCRQLKNALIVTMSWLCLCQAQLIVILRWNTGILAEGRPLRPFICCLLTYCKATVLVVVVLWLSCVLVTVPCQCLSLKHFNSVTVLSRSNP